MRVLALVSALFLAVTCQQSLAQSLDSLVQERLSLMRDVAAYKWLHKLAIEDLAREQVVLAKAHRDSLQQGLEVEPAQTFFQQQMDAAKEIQRYWFERWRQGQSPPGDAPDLNSELRPTLIRLGSDILARLGREQMSPPGPTIEGLSPTTARALSATASKVTRYPDTLAQVLDSGVLRVGTTGDYAPFSELAGEGVYRGIDIDMARDLADTLDARVEWVATTWPSLMADFHAGKFDIGMSGISINLKRQRRAFFSAPYHIGGKTPIVRCQDRDQLDSLKVIDQPGVRVVVNPGGTNERFARSAIHNAQLRVYPDNRSIFDEIRTGRADVMFTDQIEVRLQSALHPDLCPAMPGETLTHASKGYLLPRDIVWKNYVDSWLAQRQGEGKLGRLFSHHLGGTQSTQSP